MNNFQGIMSGKAILQDNYPSAAYDALKKRKESLQKSMEEKAMSMKGDFSPPMSAPKQSLRPKKGA